MRVVHYTKDSFVLHPIAVRNSDGAEGILTKPVGALWCSPEDSTHSWMDWCQESNYGDIEHCRKVVLEVDMANFTVIDGPQDAETKLPWYRVYDLFDAIDFEKMVREGVDGIHLTAEGEWSTKWTHPRSLYGWDCATVVILNERCIKEVRS